MNECNTTQINETFILCFKILPLPTGTSNYFTHTWQDDIGILEKLTERMVVDLQKRVPTSGLGITAGSLLRKDTHMKFQGLGFPRGLSKGGRPQVWPSWWYLGTSTSGPNQKQEAQCLLSKKRKSPQTFQLEAGVEIVLPFFQAFLSFLLMRPTC